MYRFTAAAVAIALIAGPAFAANVDFVARVKVSDLNLQTETGAQTALARINRAALNACTDVTVGTRIGHADPSCVAQVSAELVRRLNAPMVQAAFDAAKTAKQG
jgi:UrcA family protein